MIHTAGVVFAVMLQFIVPQPVFGQPSSGLQVLLVFRRLHPNSSAHSGRHRNILWVWYGHFWYDKARRIVVIIFDGDGPALKQKRYILGLWNVISYGLFLSLPLHHPRLRLWGLAFLPVKYKGDLRFLTS